MTPKTNADVVKALRNFFDTHIQSLNGILDKLPGDLKKDFESLKQSLNDQLAKLPPLDQVPAAQDAAWALNSFCDSIVRMQEYASGLMERLNNMGKELATRTTAYNALDEQIKTGALLTKEKHSELVTLAKDEAIQSVMPQIVDMRRKQVELAGLPGAADDVLSLPAEQFNARFEEAKGNVGKLTAKGLKIGGKGDGLVKSMAWLKATEFAGQMTNIEDVLPGSATPPANPLAGNGAGDVSADERALML